VEVIYNASLPNGEISKCRVSDLLNIISMMLRDGGKMCTFSHGGTLESSAH